MAKDKSNIVKLTYREHYICHWLLYKIYDLSGDKNAMIKMACAWFRLCKNTDGIHVNSRNFELARMIMGKALRNRKLTPEQRKRIADAQRGIPLSEETKRKIADKHRGVKLTFTIWNKDKHLSESTKKKLSEIRKGRAAWNKGIECSDVQKKKQSQQMKGRHLWNNGIITIMSRECPEGFVKGRLKK